MDRSSYEDARFESLAEQCLGNILGLEPLLMVSGCLRYDNHMIDLLCTCNKHTQQSNISNIHYAFFIRRTHYSDLAWEEYDIPVVCGDGVSISDLMPLCPSYMLAIKSYKAWPL